MKLRLLGTGSAESIPAMFSNSRVSEHARRVGGKDVRSRSGALLDGIIKIDFGPDTVYHIHRDQLDAREWAALFFTHSHDDHCCITQLQYLVFPFNQEVCFPFPFYGNEQLAEKILEAYPDWPVEMHVIHSFETTKFCDYDVTPIRAHHMIEEEAQNLIFQKDGKTLLYATDTGIWQEPTWEFLQDWKVDALVIEATEGKNKTDYFGHLCFDSCVKVVNRLREMGTLSSESQVITTHHSHLGDMTHDELVEAFTPHDIVVGFDGIEIQI